MKTAKEMVAAKANKKINGIDVEVLGQTVSAIKSDPELGICVFRATNNWVGGNQNRTRISGFYGAKQEMTHRQAFDLDADEPPILAGSDNGANPVEHLLHALASCLTTAMVAHSAVRGIRLQEVESEVEGDLDLRGFLGLSEDVARGYTAIRVSFKVKADPDDLAKLKDLTAFSPVFNTLTKGTRVEVTVNGK